MTIMRAERTEIAGERIVKIASSFLYARRGTTVHELLAELKEPYRDAIAIVDDDAKVEGVIVPQDLVEILGKPFGRDLLQRQSVEQIMRKADTFRYDEYIQEVTERVRGEIGRDGECQYVLVDEAGIFRGHVSSQDILLNAMNQHARELDTATRIQGRFVPPSLSLSSGRVSIACSAVMAQGVGGDYYHALEYAPGEWFFCLCDISGKGVSAAIITAVLAGFMCNANFADPVEKTVAKLNRIVLDAFKLEKYLTGFFARFSERTGELEYCDMGHAFLYACERGSVHRVSEEADNVPVGLVEEPHISQRTLRLAPGTALLVLSDGIVEQENAEGVTFPVENLGPVIDAERDRVHGLVRAKIRAFETFYAFKGEVPQRDDVSMLLFRFGE
ncbi:MAG TPA: SpoIIE family protein phosphatase [Treponemataceae bacterium]|nr:SpoIIE family protein phosphatase [Treponemataceae bacterium]